MKSIKTSIAALLLTSLTGISVESKAQVAISSPRFVRPLIERWITEYEKSNPQTHITLSKGQTGAETVSLVLTDKIGTHSQVAYFGQYAILPVTTSGSEADKILAKREWNKKQLKKLFFQQDELDALENGKQKEVPVNVYAGNGKTSVSEIFAENYGLNATDFRGKRIAGDDLFLNTAIGKDEKGVTINALSNIFDLQSRHVKNGLSILPLDVKSGIAQALGNEADLDQTLSLLEARHIDEVPVEKLGFSFEGSDHAILSFIEWVLTEGVAYNHEYGIMNLSEKELAQEKVKAKSHSLTAQR